MIPQSQPFYDNYIQVPALSPAETIVDFFFKLNVPAAKGRQRPQHHEGYSSCPQHLLRGATRLASSA